MVIVESTTVVSSDKHSKAPVNEEVAKASSQTFDNQEAARADTISTTPVVEPPTRPSNEKGIEVDSMGLDTEEVAKADSHSTSDNQEGARANTFAFDNRDIAKVDSKAPNNRGAQAKSKKDVDDQKVPKDQTACSLMIMVSCKR
ncbi:unnamed protein product [Dovyalis caffra]|uniref:Uncharacterized protein n=1 Tax=Dovyalis caffra TaxID=77055 RepID=A0AAV1QXB6_9ROSI|nr:unnamed protein product [Dovyalis caffra]